MSIKAPSPMVNGPHTQTACSLGWHPMRLSTKAVWSTAACFSEMVLLKGSLQGRLVTAVKVMSRTRYCLSADSSILRQTGISTRISNTGTLTQKSSLSIFGDWLCSQRSGVMLKGHTCWKLWEIQIQSGVSALITLWCGSAKGTWSRHTCLQLGFWTNECSPLPLLLLFETICFPDLLFSAFCWVMVQLMHVDVEWSESCCEVMKINRLVF